MKSTLIKNSFQFDNFDDDLSEASDSAEFYDDPNDPNDPLFKMKLRMDGITSKTNHVSSMLFSYEKTKHTSKDCGVQSDLDTFSETTYKNNSNSNHTSVTATPHISATVALNTPLTEMYNATNFYGFDSKSNGSVHNNATVTPMITHSGARYASHASSVEDDSLGLRAENMEGGDSVLQFSKESKESVAVETQSHLEEINKLTSEVEFWRHKCSTQLDTLSAEHSSSSKKLQTTIEQLCCALVQVSEHSKWEGTVVKFLGDHNLSEQSRPRSSEFPLVAPAPLNDVNQALMEISTSTVARSDLPALNESSMTVSSAVEEAHNEEVAQRKAEIEELQRMRDTMGAQLADLTRNREQLESSVNVLQSENRQLLTALEEKEAEHDRVLRNTVDELENNLANVKKQFDVTSSAQHDDYLRRLRESELQHEASVASLRRQMQDIQADLHSAHSVAQSYEDQVESLRLELRNALDHSHRSAQLEDDQRRTERRLQEDLDKVRQERAHLSSELVALQKRFNDLFIEDGNKALQLSALESQVQDLRAQYKAAEGKWFRETASSLHRAVEETQLVTSSDHYSSELLRLSSSLQDITDKYRNMEVEKLAEVRAAKDHSERELRDTKLRLQGEVDRVRRDLEVASSQVQRLQDGKREAETDLADLTQRYHSLDKDFLRHKTEALSANHQVNDKLRRQVAELTERDIAKDRVIDTLTAEAESASEERERLEKRHRDDLHALHDLKAKYKQTKTDLKTSMVKIRERMESLRDKLRQADGHSRPYQNSAEVGLNDSFSSLRSADSTKEGFLWEELASLAERLANRHSEETASLSEVSSQYHQSRDELHNLRETLTAKQREVSAMQRQLDDATQKKESSDNKYAGSQREIADLKKELSRAKQAMHTLQENDSFHLKTLRDVLTYSSSNYLAVDSSLESLGDASLRTDGRLLEGKCEALWREVTVLLQTAISSQQDKLSAKQQEINSLMGEVEAQQRRCIALQERHEVDQSSISELRNKAANVKDGVKEQLSHALRLLFQSKHALTAALGNGLAPETLDVDHMTTKQLESAHLVIVGEVNNISKQVEQKLSDLQLNHESTNATIQSLRQELTQLQSSRSLQVSERDSLVSELQTRLETHDKQSRAQMSALREELTRASGEAKFLLDDKLRITASFEKEKARLLAEHSQLTQDLRDVVSKATRRESESIAEYNAMCEKLNIQQKELEALHKERSKADKSRLRQSVEILHSLKNLPFSSSSLVKSVPSTPYSSFERPSTVEEALSLARDHLALHSVELSEFISRSSSDMEAFKLDVKRFAQTLLQAFDKISSSDLESPANTPVKTLVAGAHLNKYPHLQQSESDSELNAVLVGLESRVLGTVYRVENIESYLLSKKAELKSLQTQLGAAQEKLQRDELDRATMHREVNEMRLALNDQSVSVKTMKMQNGRFQARETELIAEIEALEVKHSTSLEDSATLESKLAELENALVSTNRLLNSSAAETEAHKQSVHHLTAKIEALHSEAAKLQGELLKVAAERDSVALKLVQAERESSTARLSLEHLQRLKTESECQVLALQGAVSTTSSSQAALEVDKKQLEFKVQLLSQSAASMQAAVRDSESARHDLLERLSVASQQEATAKSELWMVTREKEALSAQLTAAQMQLSQLEESLLTAAESKGELERKLNDTQDENSQFSALFADAQRTIEILTAKAADLNNEIASLGELSHQVSDMQNVRHQLEVCQEALSTAESMAEVACSEKQSLEGTVASLLAKDRALQQQLSDANALVEDFAAQSADLEKDVRALRSERNTLEDSLATLQRQLTEARSAANETASSLTLISTSQNDLQNALDARTEELAECRDAFNADKAQMLEAFAEEIAEYEAALVRATHRQKDTEAEFSSKLVQFSSMETFCSTVANEKSDVERRLSDHVQLLSEERHRVQRLVEENRSMESSVETVSSELEATRSSQEDHRAAVSELSSRITTMQHELGVSTSINSELRQENEYLFAQLKATNDEYTSSQQTVAQLRASQRVVEQQLEVAKQSSWSHSRSVQDLEGDRAQLAVQLAATNESAVTLQSTVHEHQVQLRDQERLLQEQANKLSLAQSMVAVAEKERDLLFAQTKTTAAECHDLQSQLVATKSALAIADKERETLQHESLFQSSRIIALLSEKDEYLALSEDHKRMTAEVTKRLHSVEATVARAKEGEARALGELQERQQEIAELHDELHRNVDVISGLQMAIKKLDSQVATHATVDAEHKATVDAMIAANDEVANDLNVAKQELALAKSSLAALRTQLHGLESERLDVTEREAAMSASLEELHKERNYLSSQFEAVQRDLKRSRTQVKEQALAVSTLDHDLSATRAQLSASEEQLDRVSSEKRELLGQLEDSNIAFDQFAFNLQSASRDYNAQIDEHKATIHELSNMVSLLREDHSALVAQNKVNARDIAARESERQAQHLEEVAALKAAQKEEEARVAELSDRLRSMEYDMNAMKQAAASDAQSLKVLLDSQARDIALKTAQLNDAHVEMQRLQSALQTNTLQISQRDELTRANDGAVDLLRKENLDLHHNVSQLQTSVTALKGALAEAESSQANAVQDWQLKCNVTAIESLGHKQRAVALQATVKELQDSLAAESADKAALNSQVADFERQVDSLTKELSSREQTIATLDEELTALRSKSESLASLVAEHQTLVAENEAIVVSQAATRETLESLQLTNTTLESNLAEAQLHLANQKESLEESTATMAELNAQLLSVMGQHQVETVNSVAAIAHLQTELEETSRKVSESQKLLEDMFALLSTPSSVEHTSGVQYGGESAVNLVQVVRDVHAALHRLKDNSESMSVLNAELREQMASLSSDLGNERRRVLEVTAQKDAISSEHNVTLTTLQTEVTTSHSLAEHFSEQVASQATTLKENEELIAQLRFHNGELQFNCESLVSELNYALQRIALLETNIAEKEAEQESKLVEVNSSLRESNRLLSSQMELLRTESSVSDAQLRADLTAAEVHNATMRSERDRLLSDIQQLKQLSADQSKALSDHQMELADALRDNATLYDECKQLQVMYDHLSAESERLRESVDAQTRERDTVSSELSAVYQRVQEFHDAVLGLDAQVSIAAVGASPKRKLQYISELFYSVRKRHGQLMNDIRRLTAQSAAEDNVLVQERDELISELQLSNSRLTGSTRSRLVSVLRQMDPLYTDVVNNDTDSLLAAVTEGVHSLLVSNSTQKKTHDAAVAALTEQNVALEQQIRQLSERLNEQLGRVDAMESGGFEREQELRQELTRCLVERTDLLEKLWALQEEGNSRSAELNNCIDELRSMHQRDAEVSDRHEADCAEFAATIRKLEDILQLTQNENVQFRLENERLLREKEAIQHVVMDFDEQLLHGGHSLEGTPERSNNTVKNGSATSSSHKSHSADSKYSESRTESTEMHVSTDKTEFSSAGEVAEASLGGDIMGGFEKLLKERRRLQRTCNSQQLCILSLRLLLKDATKNSGNGSVGGSTSASSSPVASTPTAAPRRWKGEK